MTLTIELSSQCWSRCFTTGSFRVKWSSGCAGTASNLAYFGFSNLAYFTYFLGPIGCNIYCYPRMIRSNDMEWPQNKAGQMRVKSSFGVTIKILIPVLAWHGSTSLAQSKSSDFWLSALRHKNKPPEKSAIPETTHVNITCWNQHLF